MKKILFAVLVLVSLSIHAQKTAEEIVDKYVTSIGGLDAFNKTVSAKMTGLISIQGNDFPITVQILNGKGMRTDVEVMGQSVIQVYYNGKAWQQNPFAGITTPTEVGPDELIGYKAQANLANNLASYKSRGHQIVLAGEEAVEGVKAWKISLTDKDNGKVSSYFISTSDFTLLKMESTRTLDGQEVLVENWYSNYKTFGGGKYAMMLVKKANGEVVQEISWGNIELGVKIDEKIFEM